MRLRDEHRRCVHYRMVVGTSFIRRFYSRIDESDVKRDIIAQYPEVGLTKRAVVSLCAGI